MQSSDNWGLFFLSPLFLPSLPSRLSHNSLRVNWTAWQMNTRRVSGPAAVTTWNFPILASNHATSLLPHSVNERSHKSHLDFRDSIFDGKSYIVYRYVLKGTRSHPLSKVIYIFPKYKIYSVSPRIPAKCHVLWHQIQGQGRVSLHLNHFHEWWVNFSSMVFWILEYGFSRNTVLNLKPSEWKKQATWKCFVLFCFYIHVLCT